jgi:hypothetical protein
MGKVKLSIDGQIDYMKNKSGIQFNIINEEEAKDFLTNNTYYFKIKSYAKNYEKYIEGDNTGKYINLEFAYLKEMSTLDMYFRRVIMKLSLDTEHFLKTQLLRDFASNDEGDGYSIIDELFSTYDYIEGNITKKERNSACSDLIIKYKGNFAIWNIVWIWERSGFLPTCLSLEPFPVRIQCALYPYFSSIRFAKGWDSFVLRFLNMTRGRFVCHLWLSFHP